MDIKARILSALRSHNEDKQMLAVLRHELENRAVVTPEDMISSMNYTHGADGSVSNGGHVTDKTPLIAMSYQERADEANEAVQAEITTQITSLERKINRLEYCISQLPEEQAAVIRGLYFDLKTLYQIADQLFLCDIVTRQSEHCVRCI